MGFFVSLRVNMEQGRSASRLSKMSKVASGAYVGKTESF